MFCTVVVGRQFAMHQRAGVCQIDGHKILPHRLETDERILHGHLVPIGGMCFSSGLSADLMPSVS